MSCLKSELVKIEKEVKGRNEESYEMLELAPQLASSINERHSKRKRSMGETCTLEPNAKKTKLEISEEMGGHSADEFYRLITGSSLAASGDQVNGLTDFALRKDGPTIWRGWD